MGKLITVDGRAVDGKGKKDVLLHIGFMALISCPFLLFVRVFCLLTLLLLLPGCNWLDLYSEPCAVSSVQRLFREHSGGAFCLRCVSLVKLILVRNFWSPADVVKHAADRRE